MGVALLGFPHGKTHVSNRKLIINTFGKVCAKFREYLKICRFISINVHKWLDYKWYEIKLKNGIELGKEELFQIFLYLADNKKEKKHLMSYKL